MLLFTKGGRHYCNSSRTRLDVTPEGSTFLRAVLRLGVRLCAVVAAARTNLCVHTPRLRGSARKTGIFRAFTRLSCGAAHVSVRSHARAAPQRTEIDQIACTCTPALRRSAYRRHPLLFLLVPRQAQPPITSTRCSTSNSAFLCYANENSTLDQHDLSTLEVDATQLQIRLIAAIPTKSPPKTNTKSPLTRVPHMPSRARCNEPPAAFSLAGGSFCGGSGGI